MVPQRITVTRTGSGDFARLIHYRGTREALLAAELAEPGMFPPVGERRRFSGGLKFMPGYFAITADGDAWLLTRWRYWRDPDAQAMSDALLAKWSRRYWRGAQAA